MLIGGKNYKAVRKKKEHEIDFALFEFEVTST